MISGDIWYFAVSRAKEDAQKLGLDEAEVGAALESIRGAIIEERSKNPMIGSFMG